MDALVETATETWTATLSPLPRVRLEPPVRAALPEDLGRAGV